MFVLWLKDNIDKMGVWGDMCILWLKDIICKVDVSAEMCILLLKDNNAKLGVNSYVWWHVITNLDLESVNYNSYILYLQVCYVPVELLLGKPSAEGESSGAEEDMADEVSVCNHFVFYSLSLQSISFPSWHYLNFVHWGYFVVLGGSEF